MGQDQDNPRSDGRWEGVAARAEEVCAELCERLFVQSKAGRWELRGEDFKASLRRSVEKRFAAGYADREEIEGYSGTLYLEDLALACACMYGSEAAWEFFVRHYRGYLRAAAGAILRRAAESPEARDLADSLFTELYGIGSGGAAERSLFRYFHGRSSLKTWLRAILAQRHVDMLRMMKRFDALEQVDGDGQVRTVEPEATRLVALDPDRARYVALFEEALRAALADLQPRDAERLRAYYVEKMTLAEIGRRLREHESSVSRNLERVRGELREGMEAMLRSGRSRGNGTAAPGLSEAEIALCIEYAGEDVAFDLEKMLKQPASGRTARERQKP